MKYQNLLGWPCLCFIVLLAFWGGCGGGTRGSGGQYFDGFIADSSSRRLGGVTISVLATGDSAVSDEQGTFTIQTNENLTAAEFLLESPTFSTRARVDNIPADAARVFVRLTVGIGPAPSVVTEFEVTERRPGTRLPNPVGPGQTPPPVVAATPTFRAEGTRAPVNPDRDDDDSDDDFDNDSDDDDSISGSEDGSNGMDGSGGAKVPSGSGGVATPISVRDDDDTDDNDVDDDD